MKKLLASIAFAACVFAFQARAADVELIEVDDQGIRNMLDLMIQAKLGINCPSISIYGVNRSQMFILCGGDRAFFYRAGSTDIYGNGNLRAVIGQIYERTVADIRAIGSQLFVTFQKHQPIPKFQTQQDSLKTPEPPDLSANAEKFIDQSNEVADCKTIWMDEDDASAFVYFENGRLVSVYRGEEKRYETRGAGTGIAVQIVETEYSLKPVFHVNSVRGDNSSRPILIYSNQAWYPEKRCR